ncbi:MAG: TonB-dependent receptor [Pseudomonadota bacterium]
MTSIVTRPAHPVRKPLVLAIAIAAAFPVSLFAQATQEKTLAPVIITSSRMPQKASDVLADNVLITSEEIAKSGHVSIVDLLQQKRGIEITRNGGPGSSSSIYIRGAENKQSVVLIDGVRISASSSGGATWQTIPLSLIDHIEIVYGPLSTLYGADAMGGVIQIFTKKGDGPPRLSASAGVGSYGTRTIDAGISGSAGEAHTFRYAIGVADERSDGFSVKKPAFSSADPDLDGYRRKSVNGQLSIDVAKGHQLGLIFLNSRLESQFDNAQTISGKLRFFDDRNVSRLGTFALYGKNQILPNWLSQIQLSQSTDKLSSTAGARTGSVYRIQSDRFDTTQRNLNWQNDFTFGTDVLQLLAERRVEKVDSTERTIIGDRTTNSFAASYQLKRGSHLASAGVRNDRSAQFGSNTTGSLAYGYRITPALRANASYGTSFRAPTFNELYYTQFGVAANKPEEGKNAEAGLYYDDGRSQFTAVYYRNMITNLIVNTNPCPVAGTYPTGCAYNVNRALLTGISLGASTKLGNFTLRGSFDFQDPHDETSGKDLPRRAKRHGSVAIDYTAGAIKAGAETVFAGKRFDTSANTTVLSGYALLNLYASVEVSRDWSVYSRWDNVLNKDYELARNYATAGSTVFVGVRYGFK